MLDEDGNQMYSIGSTTDLDTKEYSELVEQLKIWAAQFLNVVLPEPNTNILIKY